MGALIHLAPPVPGGASASRVYYSVGRTLTASDFALQSSYVEARLLGLAPAAWGVISGLAITPQRFDTPDGATGLPSFSVGPGTATGSDGRLVRLAAPITLSWKSFASAVTNGGSLADGAYLLLLRTVAFEGIQGPPPDPCTLGSPDPLLDIEQVSFVEIWLSSPIGPLPASFSPSAVALSLNTLAGGLNAASLEAAVGAGVPVAMILVKGGQAVVLSQAAGRLPSGPAGPAALLLAQTREAFAMASAALGSSPPSPAWETALSANFRFLPGAGELPTGMLLDPVSVKPPPACPFFPPGFALYLEVIRSSQAANLLQEALPRPLIDLASTSAEAVTLALAVPDALWSPDLLDMPQGDPVLAADLHLAYARARAAQVAVREAWIALYGGMINFAANNPLVVGFLAAPDTAAQNVTYLINNPLLPAADVIQTRDITNALDQATTPATLIPWIAARVAALTSLAANPPPAAPPPATLPTTTPATAAQLMASLGYQVADQEPAQADPSLAGAVPPLSDTILAPLFPALPPGSAFANWTAAITAASPDPTLLQPLIDAGLFNASDPPATRQAAITALLALPAAGDPLNDDTQPGALLQLAVLQLLYAVLVRVSRAQESALEAYGRLIALQRQHLDIVSTYVSALAGGVPSDGSGLSFTRIIPFMNLTPPPPTPAPTPTPSASTPATPQLQARFVQQTAAALPVYAATRSADQLAAASAAALGVQRQFVPTATINGAAGLAPKLNLIGSRLGTSQDIAQTVATEAGALSQSPPFAYAPVTYGTAAHITPADTVLQTASDGLAALHNLMALPPIGLTPSLAYIPPAAPAAGAIPDDTAAYGGIVSVTRCLLSDIGQVEAAAIAMENGYLLLSDRLQSMVARVAQLTDAIAAARDALRTAQCNAAQSAGDYGAAQQLIQEEIARVAAATTARNQAIGSATGLFYVRELQSLTAIALPPGLSLAADTPGDLAPGCPIDHPGPPAAIQPFLDQLLEVPLANWRPLQNRWTDLPDIAGLQRLGALRTARVANWTPSGDFGNGAAAGDLANLAATAKIVFDPVFRQTIAISPSLAASQTAAFGVLAPPDIIALPPSLLRTGTEALRARLESASGCLCETLASVPASTRFNWANLFRAGALPPLVFAQWPLSAGPAAPPGDSAAATLRRLSGIVTWMSTQLQDGSSAAAQTALGNLVAACVIASAYGDPDDSVTGTIVSGGVPLPGVPIRVILNRPPPIGTVLNLLDAGQNILGTLRIQDHDATGTTATIVTSTATTAPTAGWSVSVPGRSAPWLPS
jgi:hypothetical protein